MIHISYYVGRLNIKGGSNVPIVKNNIMYSYAVL
jgi:hypothetical protein